MAILFWCIVKDSLMVLSSMARLALEIILRTLLMIALTRRNLTLSLMIYEYLLLLTF